MNASPHAAWNLALPGARANKATLAGTGLILAVAGAFLSVIGVLTEAGARAGSSPDVDGSTLIALTSSFSGTAILVVLFVVSGTVRLALRRRRRESALLRTVGATAGQVRQVAALEVLLVALVSVPLGAIPGLALTRLLTPLLHDAGVVGAGFTPPISPLPVVAAVAMLMPTALLAGVLAARETTRMSPTEAVRQTAYEPPELGAVRRITALVLTVLGVGSAFTPLFVPGLISGASAAVSAFLLVAAASVAGPRLVASTFSRVRAGRSAPALLAVANVRGFSRRLTAVVVPLAMLLAIGSIQSSADRTVQVASTRQLDAATKADLVVTAPHGLSDAQVAALGTVEGVTDVVPLGQVAVSVRTDDTDMGSLAWEPTALRVVPADASATTFDPKVTSGSLSRLSQPNTVAISSDAAFETGTTLGEKVDVRWRDGVHPVRVVAVFDRGLGVGGYIVAPKTAAAHHADTKPSTVLVSDQSGSTSSTVAGRIAAQDLQVTSAAAYVAGATNADAAMQHLSSVLLLLLLVFIALGAANALVLATAGRREELTLLHRTGATQRQLLRMLTAEGLVTAGAAWVIGTVAVLPAVLGISYGLLGASLPTPDLVTYGLLSASVLAIAMLSTLLSAVPVIRGTSGASSGAPASDDER